MSDHRTRCMRRRTILSSVPRELNMRPYRLRGRKERPIAGVQQNANPRHRQYLNVGCRTQARLAFLIAFRGLSISFVRVGCDPPGLPEHKAPTAKGANPVGLLFPESPHFLPPLPKVAGQAAETDAFATWGGQETTSSQGRVFVCPRNAHCQLPGPGMNSRSELNRADPPQRCGRKIRCACR